MNVSETKQGGGQTRSVELRKHSRPSIQQAFASPGWRAGCVVWFTGLSGSGKTTLAKETYCRLHSFALRVEILDGDAVRQYLSKDLSFSPEDRIENIRRISFVANLLARQGVIVLVPAIAPYRAIREEVRKMSPLYIEVFVSAPLEVCERRDPKGLYKRARAGEITNFTGLTDPYEPPERPDVLCRTDLDDVKYCVNGVISALDALLTSQRAQGATDLP